MNSKNIITLVIACLTTINMILTASGHPVLPITDDQINLLVTSVFQIASILATIWQNFNFTTAAKKGQVITDVIKEGKDVAVSITTK